MATHTWLVVDGENFRAKLKQALRQQGVTNTTWHTYDYAGLFATVLAGHDLRQIFFYFAKLKEHPATREKSKRLIEDRRLLKTHLERVGYKVVMSGQVRAHEEVTKGVTTLVFKEKGVDVKIAVDLVTAACDKKVTHVILASSDSDLQPAIAELKARGVETTYLGFEISPNKGLTYTTDKTILIRNAEVARFRKE